MILKPGIAAAALAAAGLIVTDIAAEGGGPQIGRHVCYVSGLHPGSTFFYLYITGPDSYRSAEGKTGRYRFDPGTGQVEFVSGPLQEFAAAMLQGRLHLGVRKPGRPFYNTACNFKP